MGCFRSNLPVGVWAEPSATWVSILCPQGSGEGEGVNGKGKGMSSAHSHPVREDLMVMNILIVN